MRREKVLEWPCTPRVCQLQPRPRPRLVTQLWVGEEELWFLRNE